MFLLFHPPSSSGTKNTSQFLSSHKRWRKKIKLNPPIFAVEQILLIKMFFEPQKKLCMHGSGGGGFVFLWLYKHNPLRLRGSSLWFLLSFSLLYDLCHKIIQSKAEIVIHEGNWLTSTGDYCSLIAISKKCIPLLFIKLP